MFSVEEAVRKNNAVMKILGVLSKGASFGVVVEDGEKVIVARESNGVAFRELGAGDKPDFVISMPEEVLTKLFSEETSVLSAQEFLVFSAKLLSGGYKEKINLVIYANFLKLTLHGYLKILSLGGTAFLKVLKDNGLGSIFAIEKKLSAFKNK